MEAMGSRTDAPSPFQNPGSATALAVTKTKWPTKRKGPHVASSKSELHLANLITLTGAEDTMETCSCFVAHATSMCTGVHQVTAVAMVWGML